MKKGWYILNYHDISYEENDFISGIGGTYPPDIFFNQIKLLAENARLMSVQEAFELYKSNAINEPIVSIWFDDGLRGVSKYAAPILESFNVTAATSLNSDFFMKEDIFWGNKLSYFKNNDGLRFLRAKLKKEGFSISVNDSLKSFTKDNFSIKMHHIMNDLYVEMTSDLIMEDAKRLYDGVDAIKTLQNKGWLLANHSQSHYPITNENLIHLFEAHYLNCEEAIKKAFGIETEFWVLPFDRPVKSSKLMETFHNATKNKTLVFVGDRINKKASNDILYRISVPYLEGKSFIKYLSKKSYDN